MAETLLSDLISAVTVGAVAGAGVLKTVSVLWGKHKNGYAKMLPFQMSERLKNLEHLAREQLLELRNLRENSRVRDAEQGAAQDAIEKNLDRLEQRFNEKWQTSG